jgi:hypothetical protein
MRFRGADRNVTGYVLSIALLLAIAAAAVLIALQLRGDAPVRFDAAPPQGVECPPGEGTPACFRFTVTNLGNRPSIVRCEILAQEGTNATFLTNAPVYVSAVPFDPGVPEELLVKVDANPDDIVTEPVLVCRAV